MGFDIYGLDPKKNCEKPEILKRNPWEIQDEEVKDEWFEAQRDWEYKNPGVYFRNNVWWWRPLWDWVCNTCQDVMTEGDQAAGWSNSGTQITAETVDQMLDKLVPAIAEELHKEYELSYKTRLEGMPLMKCDTCDGTGQRDDKYVKGECNGCGGKGERPDWDTQYPFDHKNVEEFVSFLSESGGIEIC